MSAIDPKPVPPSQRLLEMLSTYRQALVIMHDNPDPDAIATGWAVKTLVEAKLGVPVRLIGGGAIVRAENKHLVELLAPPIELVDDFVVKDGSATILVDCGMAATNHLASRIGIRPVAVIDHHLHDTDKAGLRFADIRADAAASASIATSYLQEQNVEPSVELATAILYAMRTETCGSETQHSALDRFVVSWVTDRADPSLLAEIENAPLDRDYFGDLVLAMQRTFVYDDVAICFLPKAAGAEIVGEVADLLVRCRGIRRVLCAAIIGNDLLVSARTQRGADNAAVLLDGTLHNLGSSGGHAHRAGGKISNANRRPAALESLYEELSNRWLAACSVDRRQGTPLIARHEIIENL